MKKNLLLAILCFAVLTAFGQKIPFQGKLVETGTPVNGTRTLEFSIASQSWSEIHTDVPITDGLYFVVLGSITPLPDSLFYGTDEQTLDISVDGTALSPVILFKPLSTPYEGNEVNVRNTDGTVVGTLKARTDTVKHGEFSILGENSGTIEAGFYKAPDEAETDMPYVGLQKDSAYLVSISTRKNGTSLNGSLYLGSNFDESISHNQKGWFAFKDSVHTGQFQSQNWGGLGASGYLAINGTNTINVNISSRHWENPNLPWMKLIGSDNQDVIQMSAENDDNESGNIKILSKSGNSVYMNADHINIAATNGNNYIGHDQIDIASHTENRKVVLNPNSIEIIDTEDENNWKGMFNLTSQNWNSNGSSGLFRIYGPTTQNFEITGKSWEDPDLPWFKISGKQNHDAIQLSVDNDSVETAFINLNSLDGSSSHLNSRSLGIRGPSSQNIDMGSKEWEDKDFGYINIWGRNNGNNDFHAMEISVSEDGNGDQFGYINLNAENGKNLHLSPEGFGVEGVGMSTINHANGNYGSLNLNGPNSNNIQLMPDWWDKADMGFLQVNGTSSGRVELEVNDDGNGNGEYGLIHLYSDAQKSIRMEPTSLAFRDDANDFHHLLDMGSNNNSGNGWAGHFNVRGPNSDNFNMSINGNNPDMPYFGLNGERTNLMHLTGISDPNNEFGYMHIMAEDGSSSNINAFRIENVSNDGRTGNFSSSELRFDENGDFMSFNATGIGGSLPIEIQNGANITNDLNVNGNIIATGTITPSSDRRFKKNIQTIGTTLQKVELIEGVSYNWRQDEFPEKNFSSDKQIGVIAQDLEAQFPALVKTDKDGYKSVNYNGFTAVLLEAVKELNAKVEKLETENLQLKAELTAAANNSSEINQLKQQMEMLTKMVQQNSTVESSAVKEIVSTPGLN